MKRFRVMIADDHRLFAEGLRVLLQPEFDIVGLAEDGLEMIEMARTLQPDVIVSDVSMPSLSGIEATARLRDLGINARVVILTQHRDVTYARSAIAAGASGYVLKHAAASELISAIREAIQGRSFITPMIAGELLSSYCQEEAHQDPTRKLTARQQEVIKLVAEGCSAKQIASTLNISVRTAEAHKANAMETLGLKSTAELVQYAIRNGIISI
jgi:DNA-binding NarL/FixJ family response regulator